MNELVTLTKLEKAKIAIREVKTLEEIKNLVDQAEALKAYVESAKESAEIQAIAAEVLMRATRKLGEISATLKRTKGNRYTVERSHGERSKTETLYEMGLTRRKAKRAEKMAEIPEKEFEETIAAAKAATSRITKSLFATPEEKAKTAENSKATRRVAEYRRTGKKPAGWRNGADDELARRADERDARLDDFYQEKAEKKTEAAQYQDDPFPAKFQAYLATLPIPHQVVVCNSVMKICRSTLAKARK